MEQQRVLEPISIEISVPSKGIVLKEESKVAVQKETKTLLETEQVMKDMFQKAAGEMIDSLPRLRTGLLLRKRSEQKHVELYKKLLKDAGAKEILVLPTDVPADMLQKEEEKCKIIVSIEECMVHMEQ